MSRAGGYFKTGLSIVDKLAGEKPHSSITDWVEILSSDRYEEMSLDGIPELVDSVNLQREVGTTEAARAVRKKLKYGNVHRQLRALVILRALTENANKGFQLNWANEQLMQRLRAMATDSLLDPKVKKRLILTFHAWSLQYADEPRMREVASLYGQYSGKGGHKKTISVSGSGRPSGESASATAQGKTTERSPFHDDTMWDHSWEPAAGTRGKDTYADLAAARADAEERKRQREAQIALEQKEAELDRREREIRRKQEMEAIEARRRREAEEEAERRKAMKENRKKQPQPQRPKFNFEKEKPKVMASVANAVQSANNLVNACRLVNRETESVTTNPKVQDNLDKAKEARRVVIRYIQLVNNEEYVGTLIDANEKVVEAIQLYDKLSKSAALDSESEHEDDPRTRAERDQVQRIRARLDAQKLEAQRTGEVQQLQEQQMVESQRRQARKERRSGNASGGSVPPTPAKSADPYADLRDLEFALPSGRAPTSLPPPMRPDSDTGSYEGGTLSDFSDYDSSDEEWRATHSRRQSRNYDSYNNSRGGYSGHAAYGGGSSHAAMDAPYASLDDNEGSKGLLDPNDPFGDPFGDDNEHSEMSAPKQKTRIEWGVI